MTNDETAFREVDEAMAADRQNAFFRENGTAIIGGALAIVATVAGWQLWSAQKSSTAEKASMEFATATEMLAKSAEDGRVALEAIAENGPDGYAVLAELRTAASLAATDRSGALAIYRKVYASGSAPRRLRELARLRAAALAFPDGRDAVLADLGELPDGKSTFSYYASELAALAALQAKDYQGAESMFRRAAADSQTPGPVRQRAEEFAALAAAGKAGVNLTGEARVDDLLEALGEHDHGAEGENAEQSAGPSDLQTETPGGEEASAAENAAQENEGATGEDQ